MLLIGVDKVLLTLLQDLTKTLVIVLKYVPYFLVRLLDIIHVFLNALEKSKVFSTTKSVNGRCDVLNEIFKV